MIRYRIGNKQNDTLDVDSFGLLPEYTRIKTIQKLRNEPIACRNITSSTCSETGIGREETFTRKTGHVIR